VLNAIELAVETTSPDAYGLINITTEVAEESIQRRAVLYDKDGDAHFDIISAFIKSLRGSDPDAAMYWMAKMIYAGEDPRFIFRRMLIFAGEDVGMADPNALRVVTAAAQAFDYVGMPEGRFHLAEACLYLATAPKSNSGFALFDALAAIEQEREADVPNHIRDGNRDTDDFGHGQGYLYPHSYRDHWVAQQYLPDRLQGRVFYQPSDQGYEATIQDQVARRREEQLAAMLEPNLSLAGEVDKIGKGPATHNRWLQRTLSSVGQQLGQIRDKVFALAKVQRHDLVLDLNGGTGLLTWEAVRRAPVGGVWVLAANQQTAKALTQQANNLAPLEQPVILTGSVAGEWNMMNDERDMINEDSSFIIHHSPFFDVIIGRNVFTQLANKRGAAEVMTNLLKPGGRLVLAEIIPKYTQRLHQLVDLSGLSDDLVERVIAAEEAIYANSDDLMVNWDETDLQRIFEVADLPKTEIFTEISPADWRMGVNQIERWFDLEPHGNRPTYAQHLLKKGSDTRLDRSELETLKSIFQRQLADEVVSWQSTIVYLIGYK
jgi:putative ATPase